MSNTEIEDEQLWDGQARSSRYQDFSRSGFVTPPELAGGQAAAFQQAGNEAAIQHCAESADSCPGE